MGTWPSTVRNVAEERKWLNNNSQVKGGILFVIMWFQRNNIMQEFQ